jgi:hypothetical protein
MFVQHYAVFGFAHLFVLDERLSELWSQYSMR